MPRPESSLGDHLGLTRGTCKPRSRYFLRALVQRLTIDAATPADLRVRLRAAQAGFTAEGLHLAVPKADPAALSLLGPRLTPGTMHRLRRLVCPTTAAAVKLARATDAEARFLLLHQPRGRRNVHRHRQRHSYTLTNATADFTAFVWNDGRMTVL